MLITVHGEHTLELAPEHGTLRLGAQHEGSSADEVMEALQRTLGELVAALDELAARTPSPVVHRTVGTPRTHHWTDHLPDGVRAVRHVAAATVAVELADPGLLGGVGGDAGGMAESGGGVRALAASAETVDPEPAPLRIRARVHARFEA